MTTLYLYTDRAEQRSIAT